MAGLQNGALPDAMLVTVPSSPSERLRPDAVASWERVVVAARAVGSALTLTDGYRPASEQEAIFRQRYTTAGPTSVDRAGRVWQGRRWYRRAGAYAAAVPGTSNHGLGETVDVRGLTSFTSALFTRVAPILAEHGWSNAEGHSVGEPWHWRYYAVNDRHAHDTTTPTHSAAPATTAPTSVQEDDDMAIIIFNGKFGSGVLDGGRLIGLGDGATVDAFQAAGCKRVPVTDADFIRMRTQSAPGVLLYNGASQGGRGWAYLTGGKAVGLGDQAAVDSLKGQGCPVLNLSAADFARFVD